MQLTKVEDVDAEDASMLDLYKAEGFFQRTDSQIGFEEDQLPTTVTKILIP